MKGDELALRIGQQVCPGHLRLHHKLRGTATALGAATAQAGRG